MWCNHIGWLNSQDVWKTIFHRYFKNESCIIYLMFSSVDKIDRNCFKEMGPEKFKYVFNFPKIFCF